MLSFGFISAILIEILLPFALGIWFVRKFGASWKIFGVGVLTFIASQIVHFPILYGLNFVMPGIAASLPATAVSLINALILGLAAGICEETARWVGFRLLKSRAKSVGASLMAGAGHGGVESIIIGLVVLVNYAVFMIVSSGKGEQFGLPLEMQMSMAQQMYAYASMPWWMPLIGALERVFAISLHLALSFMVWQAFKNRSWRWFIAAVLWHTFVDAAAVLMSTYQFNVLVLEGVIGLLAAANVVYLIWFVGRELDIEAEEAEEESGGDDGEILSEGDGLTAPEESEPVDSNAEATSQKKATSRGKKVTRKDALEQDGGEETGQPDEAAAEDGSSLWDEDSK